jgi:hypothetical protein
MSNLQLGQVDPKILVGARLELHWAAQILGSVGLTYGVAVPDFSHTSLTWIEKPGVLGSPPLGDRTGTRFALKIDDLSLLAIGENGSTRHPLAGQTLDAGYHWLSNEVSRRLDKAEKKELLRFEHEMPGHPVKDGAEFAAAPTEHFAELGRWYATAFQRLRNIAARTPAASPVRCWPHHFDVASLVHIDPPGRGEEARSIGVGMSPGDGSYPEPYWYVTPWPYPAAKLLPELDTGHWHTEGWVGAVLTGTEFVDQSKHANQKELIDAFLQKAASACRTVLKND